MPCNVSLSPDPSNKRKPCQREPGSYHPAKLTCTHPQYICTSTLECGLLRRLCVPEEPRAADGQGASGRDVRLRLSGSSQCHSNRCGLPQHPGSGKVHPNSKKYDVCMQNSFHRVEKLRRTALLSQFEPGHTTGRESTVYIHWQRLTSL